MSSAVEGPSLAEFHAAESARIRRDFETTGDGRAAIGGRAALLDALVLRFHLTLISADSAGPEGLAILALGGYGRRALFPHSDIDLLFLCETEKGEQKYRDALAALGQGLWDLRLRASPATRTLAECGQFNPDNPEFSLSLLDSRLLAGDAGLAGQLRESVIPAMVARDRTYLVRALGELVRARHAKHGNTIFHLEPNVKDAPGGLRDYATARWMVTIAELGARRGWPEPENRWPEGARKSCGAAFDFLSAVRCFLHYRRGRDDNILTYELQDAAAGLGIGIRGKRPLTPSGWMRTYYENARAIEQLAARMSDEAAAGRPSLYATFAQRRSRLSNADFTVVREQIFLRQPALVEDTADLLRAFAFLARHGLALGGEAERQIEERVARAAGRLEAPADFWGHLRQILLLPDAARALRAMHRTGVLAALFPEFKAIDALVIRDFYHRYTVDEHSFLAIERLLALRRPESNAERRFQELFGELEQPELLLLTLLLHDVGKGMAVADHVQGSLAAAEGALERLRLPAEERDTVRFLIANHLEMSATMQRRDIADPAEVRRFARTVGSPERLKMLCLLTYADIGSVNPGALTPWRAEMLWQLHAAAANHLNRGVDEERFERAQSGEEQIRRVLEALRAADPAGDPARYLEGFPRRYLASHSAEQIAAHYRGFLRLAEEPIQIGLERARNHYTLTLLAGDRPRLFTTVAGVLYAWGMSIRKAEAFSSRAGIVLDTFHFLDPYRTLELNPPERERLKASLVDVLAGREALEASLARRAGSGPGPAKVRVETAIGFDDASSAHSTILEIVARDRPGLLHQISATLADAGCNIEVALIDTEGPKAIDVFYLTAGGKKLDAAQEAELERALGERLD